MATKLHLLALVFCTLLFVSTVRADGDGSVDIDEVEQTKRGSATDSQAAEREAEAMSYDGLSAKERELLTSKQEKFEFQAEVNRLMDIIIHSLYSNREIFIRELISNAADALDKIRFMSLTDKTALGEGAQAELDIRISYDKTLKTITLTDKGVGMTKAELKSNLGVVAKSGTTEFVERATAGADTLALIGQFGVGFYSVYLVADSVSVASKSNDDPVQHIWESTADSTFTVAPDPRGNTLGRGTSVTLKLKEDAEEFLNEQKLEGIVARYSSFINFPIFLQTTKTVDREEPVEEADEAADEESDEVEVTEDEEEDKPKTKTVKEEVKEWKRLNTAKAIWTRNPKDITDEEYNEFYESLTKDTGGPMAKTHFSAEGEITFRSILYVPKKAESGLYDKFYEKSTALKLYVRRVLIADQFDEFLPRYLNFIKGVVDSEDLPLNVSRETLAQNRVLKVMSKKITRKVLEMLRKLASPGKGDEDDEDSGEEEKTAEEVEEGTEKKENKEYAEFWEQYGKSIKLGLIDDRANKSKLSKLVRYQTSKSDGKFIGLEDYVERMKEDQKQIYYITGETLERVEKSPFMERLKKLDLEVIYMVDPLDEYVVQTLTEFDGNSLQSVTKADLSLPGDDKEKEKTVKENFKAFTTWLQGVYGEKVEKVTVGTRLAESPMVLVTGQYGWSANMERIMKAQTFADASKANWMHSKKTLEINPRHPIVRELKKRFEDSPSDESVKDLANLLYDSALLNSGFAMDNVSDFASRINRVVSLGLAIDPAAPVLESIPEEIAVEAEETGGDDEEEAVEAEDEHGHDEL